MKDAIKERLNSIRNEMTHIWGTVFVIGGGSLALLKEHSILSLIVGIIGLLAAGLFFNTYFLRRNEVFNLLQQLEELKK